MSWKLGCKNDNTPLRKLRMKYLLLHATYPTDEVENCVKVPLFGERLSQMPAKKGQVLVLTICIRGKTYEVIIYCLQ